MKRFFLVAISLIVLAAISAPAAPKASTANEPAFPGILANARYVYVASYNGDQFDPNLLPEDRDAIGAVQNAIQEWGKLVIVYQPSEADIVLLVMSRAFRRCHGRVRCAPEWQFSLARDGTQWSPIRRNSPRHAI